MTWDDEAATWENVATRAYAEAAFDSLERLLLDHRTPLAGAYVCDFGCGTGLLTERLADHCSRIDAVDTSAAMIEVLKAKIARLHWSHVRPCTELPASPLQYDVIVCSSVCAFLDDYAGTVKRLALRLKPGGFFLQWDWELNPDDEEPMGLSRRGIRDCLQDAGLDVLSVDTAFTIVVDGQSMTPLLGAGKKPAL